MNPRSALARDVWDARRIYMEDGLYTPEIRKALQDVIKMNKERYGYIFNDKSKSLGEILKECKRCRKNRSDIFGY